MTRSMKEQFDQQPDQVSTTTEKPSEVKEDGTHLPTGTRLLAIITSILFAMFLVALVWMSHFLFPTLIYTNKTLNTIGPHHHRHSSPPNRKPVQCP